jgi:hypothetical protein
MAGACGAAVAATRLLVSPLDGLGPCGGAPAGEPLLVSPCGCERGEARQFRSQHQKNHPAWLAAGWFGPVDGSMLVEQDGPARGPSPGSGDHDEVGSGHG